MNKIVLSFRDWFFNGWIRPAGYGRAAGGEAGGDHVQDQDDGAEEEDGTDDTQYDEMLPLLLIVEFCRERRSRSNVNIYTISLQLCLSPINKFVWRKVNIKLQFVFSIDLPATSDKLLIKEPIQKMSIGSAVINLAYLLPCSVSAPPRMESAILVFRPPSKDKLDLELFNLTKSCLLRRERVVLF